MVKSDDFLLARAPLSCIGGWRHLCACSWGRDSRQGERGGLFHLPLGIAGVLW